MAKSKEDLKEELTKLKVEFPEDATSKVLNKLLKDKKKELKKEEGAEAEPKGKFVTLYDQNENPFKVKEKDVDRYIEKGFRKELPKK